MLNPNNLYLPFLTSLLVIFDYLSPIALAGWGGAMMLVACIHKWLNVYILLILDLITKVMIPEYPFLILTISGVLLLQTPQNKMHHIRLTFLTVLFLYFIKCFIIINLGMGMILFSIFMLLPFKKERPYERV